MPPAPRHPPIVQNEERQSKRGGLLKPRSATSTSTYKRLAEDRLIMFVFVRREPPALSNRSQPRPLCGVFELLGMAFAGAGRAVDKWPAGATVQSLA
jgi:hypothetical protein